MGYGISKWKGRLESKESLVSCLVKIGTVILKVWDHNVLQKITDITEFFKH